MRNLWIFISKYNAVILFIIFFLISFGLLISNNSYQRASTWNSSNEWIGKQYQKINNVKDYLRLRDINDSLAAENMRLRNLIPQTDTLKTTITTVTDTLGRKQYSYITAKVINNSIRQKNNYITINRGYKDGIRKGMGVIDPNGVVGIVLNVSPTFATIQSLLHSDTRISATLSKTNAFGSLVWGNGNFDAKYAILQDVPNHIKVKKGEQVITSGYSLFPAGIPIGKVVETGLKGGDSFLNIKVELATNFAALSYVYVVNNNTEAEQRKLESSNKTE
jgi:rod shape-determining protein MreC